MDNLNFPKVFVMTAGDKWVTNALSTALTLGQVGLIEVNQFQVAVAGAGAAPSPATKPRLKFAQNVGDSSYGTVQSKVIEVSSVKRWLGQAARAATTQITYLGWDEVDGTKDIYAICGQELIVPIHLYEKKMARWYNPVGFHRSLIVDTGCCPDCGSPCTAADKTYIADTIAALINTGQQRVGDYEVGNEFGSYLIATVVTNGLTGAALRVGVKIETRVVDNDDQAALSSCDPNKFWEFQTYYFNVGGVYNGYCDGTKLPVTTTQQADPGCGWAAGVAALEAESQGYDRVRDPVTAYPYSTKNGYKIFAVAGTKYDYYHLVFQWVHRVNTGTTSYIGEPYEVILIIPTGLGATIQTDINAWLAGRFTAVVL